MKKYSAFEAPIDDFKGSAADLISEWKAENPLVYIIDFEVPDGTDERTVTLIARGLMWEDGWTESGTISTVVEDLTDDGWIDDEMDKVSESFNPPVC